MNVFKISVDTKQVHKLTKENFEIATKKQTPWYQSINGHMGWFAVCPACDNPVQIIGMMERDKPFGKHFFPRPGAVSIPLMGRMDIEEYEWCPYASKNKNLSKDDKRAVDSELGKLIKQTLIEQFDRVIYLLEKCMGVKISITLAEQMLRDYWIAEGWRYRGATRQNIPWIFAYMMQAKNLYGRTMLDKELAGEICSKQPQLAYTNNKITVKEEGTLCNLSFSFIKHRRSLIGNALSESIEFNIANSEQKTVCNKIINFDYDFFLKLINNKDETYRNIKLVDLARGFLG